MCVPADADKRTFHNVRFVAAKFSQRLLLCDTFGIHVVHQGIHAESEQAGCDDSEKAEGCGRHSGVTFGVVHEVFSRQSSTGNI
jgi:hypothetical protein